MTRDTYLHSSGRSLQFSGGLGVGSGSGSGSSLPPPQAVSSRAKANAASVRAFMDLHATPSQPSTQPAT